MSSLDVSWQQIFNSLTVTSNNTRSLLFTAKFLSFHYAVAANSEDSTQFNYSASKTGWHLETRIFTLLNYCSLLLYAAKHFFIITLHGLYGKHRPLLSSIVLGVLTAPLYSNGRSMDHTENSLSIVEASLLQARLYRVVA
jgi:hypothetical protein